MLYHATDTVFCFTVLGYAAHYLCRALREFDSNVALDSIIAPALCLARVIAFFFLPSLTAFVGHHRHGRSRSVALGIEYLQGNEILRESLQIVDAVILKREDEECTFVFLFPFNNSALLDAR